MDVYYKHAIFFGSYNIIELCNHIIHSQCSQQMYMFFQIGFSIYIDDIQPIQVS